MALLDEVCISWKARPPIALSRLLALFLEASRSLARLHTVHRPLPALLALCRPLDGEDSTEIAISQAVAREEIQNRPEAISLISAPRSPIWR